MFAYISLTLGDAPRLSSFYISSKVWSSMFKCSLLSDIRSILELCSLGFIVLKLPIFEVIDLISSLDSRCCLVSLELFLSCCLFSDQLDSLVP